MKIPLFLIVLISIFTNGQIQTDNTFKDFDENFEVFQSYQDEINRIGYEIGQYKFEQCKSIALANPKYIYHCKNSEFPHGQYASFYFRVISTEEVLNFFLDEYYDHETYEIQSKFEENQKILVVNNRYHFYVYDSSNRRLSNPIIPGIGQYEREDAISGLLDAFTFTSDRNFLLGYVQGFGIFCYNITNSAQPIELKQFKLKSEINKEFFYFFQPIGNYYFLLISTQTDENFKSKNIENFYSQLKNLNQTYISLKF
jgi:hypothetical protein